MYDPMKHNYFPKVLELHRQGKITGASLDLVDIYHDSWCRFNQGGNCNCDPDIVVRPLWVLPAERN